MKELSSYFYVLIEMLIAAKKGKATHDFNLGNLLALPLYLAHVVVQQQLGGVGVALMIRRVQRFPASRPPLRVGPDLQQGDVGLLVRAPSHPGAVL